IQYPRFIKLIIADLMKKLDSIPPRLEEGYYFIKDDIPLASVYSMGNVTVRGMLISDEFITDDIHATEEYKEYMKKKNRKQVAGETISPRKLLKVTIKQKKQSSTPIPPPSDDRERDEIAKATLLMKEKLEEEEVAKMVEGDEDEESYTSEFDDYMLNDDDDFGTKIEPRSHKEHPENVDDEDENENENEKKDEDHKKV
ncbi:hypothetical protein Tco_0187434, partial [Tanacetum coccineum]